MKKTLFINLRTGAYEMKKLLSCLFLFTLLVPLATLNTSAQQYKMRKQVVGTGGMVGAVSDGIKMSGVTGQIAIEKRAGVPVDEVKTLDMYQGFWTPEPVLTSVKGNDIANETSFSNYPNPLSSNTTFKFNLESDANISLRIYDVVGNMTALAADGFYMSGSHNIPWIAKTQSGVELASGSYVCELMVRPSNGNRPYSVRNIIVVLK